jgi:ATP-dependent RNA helicase RhlB
VINRLIAAVKALFGRAPAPVKPEISPPPAPPASQPSRPRNKAQPSPPKAAAAPTRAPRPAPKPPAHTTGLPFDALPLDPRLKASVAAAGFTHCTDIQEMALPVLLAGKDVAGQAQTGTGKTATFLLALFHRLLTEPAPPGRVPTQPRAFVMAPTRELVIQIHRDAQALGEGLGLTLGLAYGGVDYEKQREQIAAGVDVLIGTPGRLIDFLKQGVYDLSATQVVVLDEADRMFDLGFINDVRYVMRRMPPPSQRLSMMFSATLAQRVLELAYEHMHEPELIRIEPEKVTVDRIHQVIYHTATDEKIPLLIGLLQSLPDARSMVFVNTKAEAERVWGYLQANDIPAGLMTGDVQQRKRERLLEQFRRGELAALVATDVAARGLHIDGVTHVFNYDLPQDAADYVHRIGRTARAGATGDAISFGCERYVYSLPDIEKYIGKKLPVEPIPKDKLVKPKPRVRLASEDRVAPRPGGGRSGGRGAQAGSRHSRGGRGR